MGDRAALDVDDVFLVAPRSRPMKWPRMPLISTRSGSPTAHPARSIGLPDSWNRADAKHAGLDRAETIGDEPRHGCKMVGIGKNCAPRQSLRLRRCSAPVRSPP